MAVSRAARDNSSFYRSFFTYSRLGATGTAPTTTSTGSSHPSTHGERLQRERKALRSYVHSLLSQGNDSAGRYDDLAEEAKHSVVIALTDLAAFESEEGALSPREDMFPETSDAVDLIVRGGVSDPTYRVHAGIRRRVQVQWNGFIKARSGIAQDDLVEVLAGRCYERTLKDMVLVARTHA